MGNDIVCVGLNYFFEMNEKQGAGVNVFSLMCRNTHTNFRQHIQRILFKASSPIVFLSANWHQLIYGVRSRLIHGLV